MERIKFLPVLTISLAFLALVPNMECHVRPPITQRPLCGSQFAVVNHECQFLPPPSSFTLPLPFPLPPPPPSPSLSVPSIKDAEEHRHHQGHGHKHRHSHHHHSEKLDNCCSWAKQVDSQCVCEVLLRLPGFLPRPAHEYTIKISDSCIITYTCGASPIRN